MRRDFSRPKRDSVRNSNLHNFTVWPLFRGTECIERVGIPLCTPPSPDHAEESKSARVVVAKGQGQRNIEQYISGVILVAKASAVLCVFHQRPDHVRLSVGTLVIALILGGAFDSILQKK